MARPREFNKDAALDKAIQLFKHCGYSATSVQDLTEATGLSRSSLYDTFGDKHALYLAALDRYIGRQRKLMQDALEQAGSKKEALRLFFMDLVETLLEEDEGGCLAVEAATEMARHDKGVAQIILRNMAENREAFIQAVHEAQMQGEVSSDKDLQATASFFVNVLHGLRITAKTTRDQKILSDIVRMTLTVLD